MAWQVKEMPVIIPNHCGGKVGEKVPRVLSLHPKL